MPSRRSAHRGSISACATSWPPYPCSDPRLFPVISVARYDRKRRADILSRTVSVDLLNRSLLSDFLPVQMLRAAGLQALASLAPLRNLMMREGINPGSALQSLRSTLREKISRKSA